MKLLYITAQYPTASGESFLGPEVRGLVDLGHKVLVQPTRPLSRDVRQDFDSTGAKVSAEAFLSIKYVLGALLWLVAHPINAAKLLRSLSRSPRHLGKNLVVVPKAIALRSIVRDEGIEHIHAHWLSTSATLAFLLSRLTGVPYSVTAHRWDIVDGNLASEKGRSAEFIRFISQSGRRMFRELHGSASSDVVIHMGVDLDSRPLGESSEGKLTERFRIACPANLVEVKGHAVLLEAVKIVQEKVNVVLDLAGDGPLATSLARKIEELDLAESVVMAGAVSHDALLASYRRGDYDCVVLPSLDLGNGNHEGIPVSLMEAMALGVPVVSTNTGGIPELLTNGDDGLLVEPGDAEALAAAILLVLEDPVLRDELSRAARGTVAREFNASRNALLLVEMMRSSVKTDTEE